MFFGSILFASFLTHTGDRGGRVGADVFCQQQPVSASLQCASIKAFLSFSGNDDIFRFDIADRSAPIVDPLNNQVASSWTNLLAANNVRYPTNDTFWTGGIVQSENCDDWTVGRSEICITGRYSRPDGETSLGDCRIRRRVLCLCINGTTTNTFGPTSSPIVLSTFATIQYFQYGQPRPCEAKGFCVAFASPVPPNETVLTVHGGLFSAVETFPALYILPNYTCPSGTVHFESRAPFLSLYSGTTDCSFLTTDAFFPFISPEWSLHAQSCFCKGVVQPVINTTLVSAFSFPNVYGRYSLCSNMPGRCGEESHYFGSRILNHSLPLDTLYFYRNDSACSEHFYKPSNRDADLPSIFDPLPFLANAPCYSFFGSASVLCINVTSSTITSIVMPGFDVVGSVNVSLLCPSDYFPLVHYSYDTIADKPITYGFNPLTVRDWEGFNVTWAQFLDLVVVNNTFAMGAPGANCMDWSGNATTLALNVTTFEKVEVSCDTFLPMLCECTNEASVTLPTISPSMIPSMSPSVASPTPGYMIMYLISRVSSPMSVIEPLIPICNAEAAEMAGQFPGVSFTHARIVMTIPGYPDGSFDYLINATIDPRTLSNSSIIGMRKIGGVWSSVGQMSPSFDALMSREPFTDGRTLAAIVPEIAPLDYLVNTGSGCRGDPDPDKRCDLSYWTTTGSTYHAIDTYYHTSLTTRMFFVINMSDPSLETADTSMMTGTIGGLNYMLCLATVTGTTNTTL
jgi:hypothetical protein